MLPVVSSGMLYLAGAIETIAAVLIGFASLQCAATAARLLHLYVDGNYSADSRSLVEQGAYAFSKPSE